MIPMTQRIAVATIVALAAGGASVQSIEPAAAAQPAPQHPSLLLAQQGKDAATEAGAGAAGQTGTPPAELSRDQAAREQEGHTGRAGHAKQHATQQAGQHGASVPHRASSAY